MKNEILCVKGFCILATIASCSVLGKRTTVPKYVLYSYLVEKKTLSLREYSSTKLAELGQWVGRCLPCVHKTVKLLFKDSINNKKTSDAQTLFRTPSTYTNLALIAALQQKYFKHRTGGKRKNKKILFHDQKGNNTQKARFLALGEFCKDKMMFQIYL